MEIRAKNKADAWKKANVIFDMPIIDDVENDGYRKHITEDPYSYINEYNNELELVFDLEDSIEITFPGEEQIETINDLKDRIIDCETSKAILLKENSELKAQIVRYENTEEQNKTLRRMLATYSKVAEDVEKYLGAVVEFREFLGKVRQLQNHIGIEGEE